MSLITEEKLKELYSKRGLTDREISEILNVDRTCIVHLRKKYNIPTKHKTIELSVEKVIHKLTELGFTIENKNKVDKTSIYDLLLDGKIRIEIMSATVSYDNTFRYPLTDKADNNHVESSYRIKLSNNRSRKLYRNTCDYIICYGVHNSIDYYWIIPSNEISDTLQTIG